MTNKMTTSPESTVEGAGATQRKSKERPASVFLATANQPPKETKTQLALKALHRKRGASIVELQQITGWQPHSVRGFLSGAVKKKLGLRVASEVGKDGTRRYRVDEAAQDVQAQSNEQAG